jgi:hypothetical protein
MIITIGPKIIPYQGIISHGCLAFAPNLIQVAAEIFYRQTRRPPLRIPFFKPEGLEAALAQLRDRFAGEHGISALAVGDQILDRGAVRVADCYRLAE